MQLIKKLLPYIAIFIVTIYLLRTFLNPGVPQTHDFNNHLARAANFYMIIRDLHFPPRWAPNLNYHFGYPVFNYMYYLSYIPAVFLFVIGFSLESSLKIVIFLMFLLCGSFMYKFLKNYVSSISALTGAILYLSSPQQLSQIFVRGNVGESTGWLLLPFVFWSVSQLINKINKNQPYQKQFLLSSLSILLLLLAHNSIFAFGTALIIGFIFTQALAKQNFKLIPLSLASIFLGIGLGAYFFIPAIFETDFITIKNVALSQQFPLHFPTITQLISSPWGYGYSIPNSSIDGMSFQIGSVLLILVIFSAIFTLKNIITYIKNKKKLLSLFQKKSLSLYFLISFFLSVYFMLSNSLWFWNLVPFLQQLQFPWRLLILSTFTASVSAAIFLNKIKISFLVPLIGFLSLIFAYKHSLPQAYLHQSDYMYLEFPFTSSVNHEQLPKGFDMIKNSEYNPQLSDTKGVAQFQIKKWKTSVHEYQVTSQQPTQIIEHLAYFPGWITYVNSKETPIDSKNPDYPGVITYSIDSGTHRVKTVFTEKTPARMLGDIISCISLITLALIIKQKNKPIKNKKSYV
jgi:hypothetical protein